MKWSISQCKILSLSPRDTRWSRWKPQEDQLAVSLPKRVSLLRVHSSCYWFGPWGIYNHPPHFFSQDDSLEKWASCSSVVHHKLLGLLDIDCDCRYTMWQIDGMLEIFHWKHMCVHTVWTSIWPEHTFNSFIEFPWTISHILFKSGVWWVEQTTTTEHWKALGENQNNRKSTEEPEGILFSSCFCNSGNAFDVVDLTEHHQPCARTVSVFLTLTELWWCTLDSLPALCIRPEQHARALTGRDSASSFI